MFDNHLCMTYKQTLEYLQSMLPMFHRIGAAAYKADLSNTLRLCQLLDQPQHKFRSVHIAGTNGKGSVSHMIASVLQSAGYKTGLFTSPHLKDFRERIRINGKKIPKKEVTSFISRWKSDFEEIRPSFFEWTAALAFEYFAREKVDVAVIETGMGGRLDSTNVVMPLLSVITNIGMDHMAFLGDTLSKIAGEKAGIIKQNVPVVIGERHPETTEVFLKKAREMNSPIFFAEDLICIEPARGFIPEKKGSSYHVFQNQTLRFKHLNCPLAGIYQKKNLVTVLAALELLKTRGIDLNEVQIRKGIAGVVRQTGLMGRWQVLGKNPLIICDVGHNEEGIKYVLNQISILKYKHLHFVLGMVNDKDVNSILSLLPPEATYYFCKPNIPRGLDANLLATAAIDYRLNGLVYGSVKQAFHAATRNAQAADLVFIGGSTFVVAEVL